MHAAASPASSSPFYFYHIFLFVIHYCRLLNLRRRYTYIRNLCVCTLYVSVDVDVFAVVLSNDIVRKKAFG